MCLELSRNGFYYVGPNDDNVKCAFCRLEISRWAPDDNIASEHGRHNPACPFITHPNNVGNKAIGREELDITVADANPFGHVGGKSY
jgi:baculoviral IAP repeat-containing protein 7/8